MLRRLLFLALASLAAPIHAETFALTGATLVDVHDFGRSSQRILILGSDTSGSKRRHSHREGQVGQRCAGDAKSVRRVHRPII